MTTELKHADNQQAKRNVLFNDETLEASNQLKQNLL